jgi:hypothetical protein
LRRNLLNIGKPIKEAERNSDKSQWVFVFFGTERLASTTLPDNSRPSAFQQFFRYRGRFFSLCNRLPVEANAKRGRPSSP